MAKMYLMCFYQYPRSVEAHQVHFGHYILYVLFWSNILLYFRNSKFYIFRLNQKIPLHHQTKSFNFVQNINIAQIT